MLTHPHIELPGTERRYALLFSVLLGNLLLYPYAGGGLRYEWFRVLGIGLTALSVYAVSFRRTTLIFAILLAVPAALNRAIFVPKEDAGVLTLLGIMFTFGFDVFILVTIFRRIFRSPRVTSSTIFGAICIYMMVGFAFSNLYYFLAKVQPDAFYLVPETNVHKVIEQSDLIYYSFGSMTSLGSAGIIPVTQQARSLTTVEAILGLFYLAVLVSRLVGLYRAESETVTNP